MKISAKQPDVEPGVWYNTTEAIQKMGMTRTTFWRKANEGKIKRKKRAIDGNYWYQGKELIKAWRLLK